MTLAAVELGDLSWDELVSLARRRIAAVSRGQWTLHAPVDPGITVLELFAWLLEQRVYWLDQAPDSLVRAILRLLGVAPRPLGIASTVLEVEPHETRIELPDETVLAADDGTLWTTEAAITIAALHPTTPIALAVGGRDHTADLLRGRLVELFAGGSSEVRVGLPLRAPPPSGVLALFFDLVTARSIAPSWRAEPSIAIEPATAIDWHYRRSDGSEGELELIEDGTGGLRRSGLVHLRIPLDWRDEPGAPQRYDVVLRSSDASRFTFPPLLRSVRPNAVVARHRARVRASSGAHDWLPLPGRSIALSHDEPPPIAGTISLWLRERAAPAVWQRWRETDDLAFHGSADRVFVTDRAERRLDFGDGLAGRLPVLARDATVDAPPIPGASDAFDNVAVEYWAGGGPIGDRGAGGRYVERAALGASGFSASALVAAIGGGEPESLVEARDRARSELARRERAITAEDHEEVALSTPGAGLVRAYAAIGAHPDHPCVLVPGAVTVFVLPYAPRALGTQEVALPVADDGVLTAVRARLGEWRLAGSQVFVERARYRRARLRLHIEGDRPPSAERLSRTTEALLRYADPLEGGDDGGGWPWGAPLRPSSLIRRAQDALGDIARIRTIDVALDDEPLREACHDVDIAAHELLALESVAYQHTVARSPGGLS